MFSVLTKLGVSSLPHVGDVGARRLALRDPQPVQKGPNAGVQRERVPGAGVGGGLDPGVRSLLPMGYAYAALAAWRRSTKGAQAGLVAGLYGATRGTCAEGGVERLR